MSYRACHAIQLENFMSDFFVNFDGYFPLSLGLGLVDLLTGLSKEREKMPDQPPDAM